MTPRQGIRVSCQGPCLHDRVAHHAHFPPAVDAAAVAGRVPAAVLHAGRCRRGARLLCQAGRAAVGHRQRFEPRGHARADARLARRRHHVARQRPAAHRAPRPTQAIARRHGRAADRPGPAGARVAGGGRLADRKRLAAGRCRGWRAALLAAPRRSRRRQPQPARRPRAAPARAGRFRRYRRRLGGHRRRAAGAGLGHPPRVRAEGGPRAASDHARAVRRCAAQDRSVGGIVRGADAPGARGDTGLRARAGVGLRHRVGGDRDGRSGDAVLAVRRQRAPARGGGAPAPARHVADLCGGQPGRVRRCAGRSAGCAGARRRAEPAAGDGLQCRFVADAGGGRAVAATPDRPADRQPFVRAAQRPAYGQPVPPRGRGALAGAGGGAGRRHRAGDAGPAGQRRRGVAARGDDLAAAGGGLPAVGRGAAARALAPARAVRAHVAVSRAAQAFLLGAGAVGHLGGVSRAW